MHILVSLTVSESKRLIARGVASTDFVKRAITAGTFALGSGTTNGYIYEEIIGEPIAKNTLVTGHAVPANYAGPRISYTHPDLVIRKGERLDISVAEALPDMQPGDVVVKGANALNYERRQAGVLIGHPTGGNVGLQIGTAVARRLRYLHPVGLEKSVSMDLNEVARRINQDAEGKGSVLWVVPGDIYTEIEALKTFADVDVLHAGSGGIGGAEGGVWLTIFGDKTQLDKAQAVIDTIRNEPPFV